MPVTFDLKLTLDGGSQLQVIPDLSEGGFLTMKLLAIDGTVITSSAVSQVNGAKFLRQLQYLHSARVTDIS